MLIHAICKHGFLTKTVCKFHLITDRCTGSGQTHRRKKWSTTCVYCCPGHRESFFFFPSWRDHLPLITTDFWSSYTTGCPGGSLHVFRQTKRWSESQTHQVWEDRRPQRSKLLQPVQTSEWILLGPSPLLYARSGNYTSNKSTVISLIHLQLGLSQIEAQ